MKVWIYLKVKTCMDEFVNVSECVLVSGSDSMNVLSVWEWVNVCVFPACVGVTTWTRACATVLLTESSQIRSEPLGVHIEPPLPTDP